MVRWLWKGFSRWFEKRDSLGTHGAAARFRSGRTQDRQLQAGGHLGGCVVHSGVRAAAEAFQQVADSVLHPLPGDFRNGFLRGRRDHHKNVRQCRICGS